MNRQVGGLGVLLATAVALSACRAGHEGGAASAASSAHASSSIPSHSSLVTTSELTRPTSSPVPAPVSEAEQVAPTVLIQEAIDTVVRQFGGSASIAVSNGQETLATSEVEPQVAWSTSKVPIAIAALRKDPSLTPVAEAAITMSDNVAAETLWANVGPEEVDAVLREAGVDIPMNAAVVRPGFTAFGQTRWSTADQAVFAANLPCVPGSNEVVDMMQRVTPEQRYGIGRLPGAAFKGGWGPATDGSYTVRQLGIYEGVGVALTVSPADGTYETAQLMATEIANAVPLLDLDLPKSVC